MKPGDLVRIKKHDANSKTIGIVIEIFNDINPEEPWVRVLFTHPVQTYQWCKRSGLEVVKKEGAPERTPLGANTGSL